VPGDLFVVVVFLYEIFFDVDVGFEDFVYEVEVQRFI